MTVSDAIWTEKYRPKTLDEVIGHDAPIKRLKAYVDDNRVPHMLLSGPPGTGKTSTVTAFARDVFGDNWKSNFHELNASDQRGIDDIRDTVKPLAQASPANGAPYKIIFLDESDQLSRDAQPALRRIIEDYSDITRFFLSCNYQNKIIPAIQSRCTPFRFSGLSDEEIRHVVERVISAEGIEIVAEDLDLIDMIVQSCRGDARSAVKYLQNSTVDGEVTREQVDSVIGIVEDDRVDNIVDLSVAGDHDEAMTEMQKILKEGANPQMLVESFLRVIRRRKDFPAPGKHMAISKLRECDKDLLHGANPHIHFLGFTYDLHVARFIDYGQYQV